jgi:hypothetical protein
MRWWVYGVSALVAVVACTVTGGDALYSWDSVTFALAVERLDVAAHRPHPPGYLALVWCARALSAWTSVPAALLAVTAIAAAASCIVIWELGRATTRSPGAALLGWSVVVSSPLLWFYASTAEIYAFELQSSALGGAAALACIRHPASRRAGVAMGAALGAAVLVKPSVAVLMLPLCVVAIARMDAIARWRALAAAVVGLGVGGAILVSVVPMRDALGATQGQVAATFRADGGFDPLHLLNRRLRDVFYALCAAVGVGGVLLMLLRRGERGPVQGRMLLAVWGAPYLLMCLFLHFPKPGYALPLIAPLALWIAGRNTGRSPRACVGLALVLGALNLLQFAARPWGAEATGGTTRYARKTASQKLATELNAISRPSRASIATLDGAVERAVTSVPERCRARPTALLVETGEPVTWRHAMYYLREPLVLQVGQRPDLTLVAQHGELVASDRGAETRAVECVGLVSHGRLVLAGPSGEARTAPGETISWVSGPSTVSWGTAAGVVVQGATTLALRSSVEGPRN